MTIFILLPISLILTINVQINKCPQIVEIIYRQYFIKFTVTEKFYLLQALALLNEILKGFATSLYL